MVVGVWPRADQRPGDVSCGSRYVQQHSGAMRIADGAHTDFILAVAVHTRPVKRVAVEILFPRQSELSRGVGVASGN